MDNWWDESEVALDETLRWQIGPRTLWITRTEREWKFATTAGSGSPGNEVAKPADAPEGEGIDTQRFAAQGDSGLLRFTPVSADRPVVVKTRQPFSVPPGAEATLFMSVPLWYRVYLGGNSTALVDEPIFRPSDTWFGPNTMTGELCYASRTNARLRLADVPVRPHRAVVVARIRNSAASPLKVGKLKIPVQHLSLFESEGGSLWTQALTLERREDTDDASVRLDDKPTHIVTAKRVAPPRTRMSKGFLLDAFGGLFVKKGESSE